MLALEFAACTNQVPGPTRGSSNYLPLFAAQPGFRTSTSRILRFQRTHGPMPGRPMPPQPRQLLVVRPTTVIGQLPRRSAVFLTCFKALRRASTPGGPRVPCHWVLEPSHRDPQELGYTRQIDDELPTCDEEQPRSRSSQKPACTSSSSTAEWPSAASLLVWPGEVGPPQPGR